MCSSMLTPGGGGTGTAENKKAADTASPDRMQEEEEGKAGRNKTRHTSMNDGET